MFGPHLMMDCYECDKDKLLDAKLILNFLNRLPKEMGVHIISGPHIIEYPENEKTWDKGGISAFVIIAESHISIHTFPHPNGYLTVDMFSCKNFDVDLAVKKVIEMFNPKEIEKKLILRGREFPKELIKVVPMIQKQRERTAQKYI